MTTESLLSGLLGDAQHPSDLLPRRSVCTGAHYRIGQSGVRGFANHAQELHEVEGRLMQGLADLRAVVGDRVALLEEGFVGVGHTSSLVDFRKMSRLLDLSVGSDQ